MSEEKKPFERLPTDVVPANYKVELQPDLKAFTFQGKLDITAKVAAEVANYLCMYCDWNDILLGCEGNKESVVELCRH